LLSVEYLEGPMSTVDSVVARVRHAGRFVHRLGHAVQTAVDRGADGWRPAVTP
jgi:hypothetical protein